MAVWCGYNTYFYDLSIPFDINSRTLVYTFNKLQHYFRDVDWDNRYAYYRAGLSEQLGRDPTLYIIPFS